jgi:EmrB/QacA subfamily drug resistance transporter
VVLAAMIFAVSMTFIDQTIVSIAVPEIQKGLGLTSTGVQWVVNGYLLSLAALFAFGGRLSDIVGHPRMVVLGVVVFTFASVMCGLTPKGSFSEAWIVGFRAIEGAGGAIMYPAALAIVVNTFSFGERGRALAVFFAIAGGFTAVGPVLGGYLTEWTWRAIFLINVPVAVIALVLLAVSRPATVHRPAVIDYRGLVLVAGGVALSVFGFQQSILWGWGNPSIGLCVGGGVVLLVAFALVEGRTTSPLIQMKLFRIRAFLAENAVLFISMLVFIPVFFFASEYAQIALGKSAAESGLFLLLFFAGFAVTSQLGGRMLDRGGAKGPVVLGCALAAVGFGLWGGAVTTLRFGSQEWYVVLSGAGMGFMLGPANTDAVNRASQWSYGEATGITQTVWNYAASLGLALLGTILIEVERSRLTTSLVKLGLARPAAARLAGTISQERSAPPGTARTTSAAVYRTVLHAVQVNFADATQVVLYVIAGVMALAAVVALFALKAGRQELPSFVLDTTEVGAGTSS